MSDGTKTYDTGDPNDNTNPNSPYYSPPYNTEPHRQEAIELKADSDRSAKAADALRNAAPFDPRSILDRTTVTGVGAGPATAPPGGTPDVTDERPWTDRAYEWLTEPNPSLVQAGARGIVRGASELPEGIGELGALAYRAMYGYHPDKEDDPKYRWHGGIQRFAAAQRDAPPPEWVRQVEPGGGFHEIAEGPSAEGPYGWLESGTRFAGSMAVPGGVLGKTASEGTKAARITKSILAGGGLGVSSGTQGGTAREHLFQGAAGAAGAAGLGWLASRIGPRAIKVVNDLNVIDQRLNTANGRISAISPLTPSHMSSEIVPQMKRIENTLGGDKAAIAYWKSVQKMIGTHWAGKKTLGGTEFTDLINDIDRMHTSLTTSGKLSPAMKTVAEGLETIASKMEASVANNKAIPEDLKGAQQAARTFRANFLRDTAKAQPPGDDARIGRWAHHFVSHLPPLHKLATTVALGRAAKRIAQSPKGQKYVMPAAGAVGGQRIEQHYEKQPTRITVPGPDTPEGRRLEQQFPEYRR